VFRNLIPQSQAIDTVSNENAVLRRQVETLETEKRLRLADEKRATADEKRAKQEEKLAIVEEKRALKEEKRKFEVSKKAAIHLPRRNTLQAEKKALTRLQVVIMRDMVLGWKAASVAIDELVRCLFVLSDKELRWNYSLPLFYDQIWHYAILNTLDYPLLCHYATTCFSGRPTTNGFSFLL
jgi:hypothetical protein